MCDNQDDKIAVEILQAYLKIPSVWLETDYADSIKFAKCLACSAGLEFSTMCLENRPVGVIKWKGTDSSAKSIIFNTHMDVAPVDPAMWDYPPFSGTVDASGNIYGAGTQETKMMAIQYIEAIKRLKKKGCTFKRTIVVLFMPDEECVPIEKMKCFFESEDMKCLNPGVWIDRAYPSPCKKAFSCYYAQKHKCDVEFHLKGTAFPAYMNVPGGAGEKLSKLIEQIDAFRACQVEQSKGLTECPDHIMLNVTNIDSNQLAHSHILPDTYVVGVTATLPVEYDLDDWKKTMKEWCCKVGEGCCLKEKVLEKIDKPTNLDSPFYKLIQETAHEMCFDLQTRVNPNASDARFARNIGMTAFGFSCLNGITLPLHGQNEYIETEKFVRGIEFYTKLIPKFGNQGDC